MTHESNYAISCQVLVEIVELESNLVNIGLGVLQQGYTKFQGHVSQVVVIDVTVSVIGKVFDVVNHASVLLTRNNLQ